ncbi:fimbrial biogenesis chaperone [Shewanella baltica]|uniref:fimbrial biogenesis chaperone n=1 Tax=Shewanella baltica TaxID=62322 RepID=UPI003D793B14
MQFSSVLLRASLFLIIFFPVDFVNASVVMTNTRVIYPSDAKERTVQFTNNDAFPNVVQVWVDVNNPESTPDNADAPFVVLPAIFRIEPNRGQLTRLIYSGDELPKDRESIFYLNFLQIPPLAKANAGDNQMLVMLKNRVKIFYRPTELKLNPDDMYKHIKFNVKYATNGVVVEVDNNSAFFASFVDVKIIAGKQELVIPVNMVEPKSISTVEIKNQQFVLTSPMTVEFTLVNDFGGFIKHKYIVNNTN